MKKLFLALIILIIGFVAILLLQTEKNKNALALLPGNPFFICKSDDPYKFWDNFTSQKLWGELRKIPDLQQVDNIVNVADSVIGSNKFLTKIFASSSILAALYHDNQNTYPLIVYDMQKFSGVAKFGRQISGVLGDNFHVIETTFEDEIIFSLVDRLHNLTFFYAVINQHIVLSDNIRLIEKSILKHKLIEVNSDFQAQLLFQKLDKSGKIQFYVNLNGIADLVSSAFETELYSQYPMLKQVSAFALNLWFEDEDMILEGVVKLNAVEDPILRSFFVSDNDKFKLNHLLPNRVTSFVNYNISSLKTLKTNLEGTDSKNNYSQGFQKLKKLTDIDIFEDFISLLGNEMLVVQTKPSNLGVSNEFAVILQGKSEKAVREGMENINRKIKENTPVKFKRISYGETEINYLAIPGFLKMIFGKILDKLEKPYYTVIGRNIVFSNHPQTLKIIIDAYQNNNTLISNNKYLSFVNELDPDGLMYTYIDPQLMYTNLTKLLSGKNRTNLRNFEPLAGRLSDIGLNLQNINDDMLRLKLQTKYQVQTQNYTPEVYTVKDMFWMYDSVATDETPSIDTSEPVFYIKDLDSRKYFTYFDDSLTVQYEVELKNGVKDGSFKAYYEDGSLKIKGKYKNDHRSGKWKYFDQNGDLIESLEFDD